MKTRFVKWIIPLVLFNSCGIRTTTLMDGYSKVPSNPKRYSNRSGFDTSLLSTVDTAVIYEAYYANGAYAVYRFYGNGCFSNFIVKKDSAGSYAARAFDPSLTGHRGVYYRRDNRIKGDLFGPLNGLGHIGRKTENLRFNGDTLSVEYVKGRKEIYIKKQIAKELLAYIANW